MHFIGKAISVRSERVPNVHLEALRKTVQDREGAAFLSGLQLGYIASSAQLQPAATTEPVVKETRKPRIFRLLIAASLILAVSGLTAAVTWHVTDAEWQGREITTIKTLKEQGWAPIPRAVRHGKTDEIYDRIHGVPKG